MPLLRRGRKMSSQSPKSVDIPEQELDADSHVDMVCAVLLVLLAWGVAIYWLAGM